ncbi:unnamed protein product [Chrysoparadoxa australica]
MRRSNKSSKTHKKEAAAMRSHSLAAASDSRKENTGRWSTEEHNLFLHGLETLGKNWKGIAEVIPTRSVVQIRTHAQKYFLRLEKGKVDESEMVSLPEFSSQSPPASPLSLTDPQLLLRMPDRPSLRTARQLRPPQHLVMEDVGGNSPSGGLSKEVGDTPVGMSGIKRRHGRGDISPAEHKKITRSGPAGRSWGGRGKTNAGGMTMMGQGQLEALGRGGAGAGAGAGTAHGHVREVTTILGGLEGKTLTAMTLGLVDNPLQSPTTTASLSYTSAESVSGMSACDDWLSSVSSDVDLCGALEEASNVDDVVSEGELEGIFDIKQEEEQYMEPLLACFMPDTVPGVLGSGLLHEADGLDALDGKATGIGEEEQEESEMVPLYDMLLV